MKTYEGQLSAKGKRFGIAVARFNSLITRQLLEGAVDCLKRHGTDEKDIEVAWVPGSFEIPVMAHALAKSKKFNSVICLGVLVRGATPHFDHIAAEATKGIAQVAFETGVPTTYGVITADTLEQAIEREGTKDVIKVWDAALSAIEMADLFDQLT